MRHDKVCTHLHYSLFKALGTETTHKWYAQVSKPVYEEQDVTVLWNQAVHTDREVKANRPHIIIKNEKVKTCTLIDMAVPAERNVVQREEEKKLKYKSLYTGCLQKNGAVSKINKKFISHLTRAKRTPSAAATVQVSHALPSVRFSCLLQRRFPRWRRSRKRLSVCFVLRCSDL